MHVTGRRSSEKRGISNLRMAMERFLEEVKFGLGPEF